MNECKCGNKKKMGRHECSGCKTERKAFEKGKIARALYFATGCFFYEVADVVAFLENKPVLVVRYAVKA